MPPPRRPPAHLLLVCLFANFQPSPASLSRQRLFSSAGSLCVQESSAVMVTAVAYTHSFRRRRITCSGLIFIITGVMIGGICLFAMYKCCKTWRVLHQTEGVEPAQSHVPPAPGPAPPESPIQQPQEDPPPYSEPPASWCRTESPRASPSAQPAVPHPGLAQLLLDLYGSEPIRARWPVVSKQSLYPLPAIPPPSYSVIMADPPATGVNYQTRF
ncbi:unnamed protein product [Lepidochelys olivacea]